MSLTAADVLQVLQNSLGGRSVSTPLGDGLICSSREAYLFSAITGATYFDSQVFPFTPKGLLKIFNSVNEYKLVGGVFDGNRLANSPTSYVGKMDYIFRGDKIIVPVEIESERLLRDKLRATYGEGATDPSILILRVEVSKRGHGLEPLMEYVASRHYSSLGFITETQVPLSHNLGSPDFLAVSNQKIQGQLTACGFIKNGFNLIELAMLSTFGVAEKIGPQSNIHKTDEYIVGEAKTSTTSMEKQLRKYCTSGIFSGAIEIHPSKSQPSSEEYGLLKLVKNKPTLIDAVKSINFSNPKATAAFDEWLESYVKAYLLGNYTNESLEILYEEYFCKKIASPDDLICLIRSVTLQDHLEALRGYLSNGCIQRRVRKTGDHSRSR